MTTPIGTRPVEEQLAAAGAAAAPAGGAEVAVQSVESELATLFATARDLRRRAAASIHPSVQPAGYGLLRLLMTNGPMRASVIAEQLGVDRSAVSRLLQSLEGLGLIDRHPDEADGRAHRAALTALGEQRMAALRADQQAMLRRSFRDWPAGDIARFADLLGQFNTTARLTDRP